MRQTKDGIIEVASSQWCGRFLLSSVVPLCDPLSVLIYMLYTKEVRHEASPKPKMGWEFVSGHPGSRFGKGDGFSFLNQYLKDKTTVHYAAKPCLPGSKGHVGVGPHSHLRKLRPRSPGEGAPGKDRLKNGSSFANQAAFDSVTLELTAHL